MDPHMALALPSDVKMAKEKKKNSMAGLEEEDLSIRIGRTGVHSGKLLFTYPHSALYNTKDLIGGNSRTMFKVY